MGCEIYKKVDMYVWAYCIYIYFFKYFLGSTDLLISGHMRNNKYELYKVWILENKITNITCA